MSDAYEKYLTFTLDDDLFALDIASVREVQDMTDITRIPQAAEHMRGVVNLRGSAVPVLDIKRKFGMQATQQTINTRIVIMEFKRGGKELLVGGLADSVKEVIEIGAKDMEPPPKMGATVHADYIKGVAKKDKRFILVLDLNQVFDAKELLDLQQEAGAKDAATAPEARP